jgi:anti-anti-sigma factor
MRTPELFWVRVENSDPATRLRLTGRLDWSAVPYLDGKIDEAQGRDLVLDLGGLTFMDASAWLAATGWKRRVQDWGGELRFENAFGTIRKGFDATEWAEPLPEISR